MYEQEKQKVIHLTILLCNSIFMAVLIGASIAFKWEQGPVVLLLLGLIVGWMMHISGRIPENSRLWIYFVFAMLAVFFYGIHEIVIDDLAAVITVFLLIYTSTEERIFVRLCALTYYLTMCYDFVFVIGDPFELPSTEMIKIFFQLIIVLAAERLAETILQRQKKDRKKTDERIAHLEEVNRSVEDFLANVSHELRTPINAVMGITTVMLKNEEDLGKKKDILSVQMAGNRLFSQIEDILDYSELDTGRVKVSEENYMIFSMINDIITENQLTKWDNGLELIFDVDAGIPSVLLGDGRKIKKVIRHLIDNAVKFTKKGGVYVRVYALQKSYGINLCIQVSDTGIGMTEEELEKIEGSFFQANGGRNRKAGGLGLGLAIVHGMVSANDGFIRIESEVNRGTTVSVSIPQKVVDAAPSMYVQSPGDLCIAIYLKPEKYAVPEVRDYYNATISHLVHGLDLTVHRVFDAEELKKLVDMYQLTHLVVGKEEYEENVSYFAALDEEIEIIVVADADFMPSDSRVFLIKKPFYCLPVVNVLNAKTSVDLESFERDASMTCPGVRVLVVDDEPMNLMVAEGIFNEYRMSVKTAGGGLEAIELCEKEDFDLIFLDHMMPGMDGVETLKRIRRLRTDAGETQKIIAFTANAVSGAREMFLREGFDEFISKPIEDNELRRLLKKVLPRTAIAYADKKGVEKDAVKWTGVGSQQISAEQTAAMQKGGTEPVQENAAGKDAVAQLTELGLHTEAGLQFCRGDRAFYENVLLKFAADAERKIADIEESFQTENIKNYQIMVHALKSSSKTIGADRLSEMAKAAEDAAKNQDAAYIKENHAELIDKYRETVQMISGVLSDAEADPQEEACAAVTEVSHDDLTESLVTLRECLDTFEADKAESLIAEMSGLAYRGTPVRELLRDVKQDVEDFELGQAAEKVTLLIGRLKGGEA